MKKSPNEINVENMKARMRSFEELTSKTACSAKWLQSTTTLYNGFTHSCHHPSPRKIPLVEIENNPTALHNTEHKKEMRRQMLSGRKPEECQYCWNIEDLAGDHMSDRLYKTTDINWSTPFTNRVIDAGATKDVIPTYFEIAFENTCNFKCAYCSPDVSSKWMEEIQQFGQYPTSNGTGNLEWLKTTGRMPIPNRENNPYIEAFWKWWPDLYMGLETFRVTGGEPLLSRNLWKLLDYIEANPRPDFILAVNTNMDVPDNLIDRFIAAYNRIAPKIKEFQVFTSCEAQGNNAEYIRFGMKYERFMNNVKKFLESTVNSRISFMVTFNALSVPSFAEFLEDVYQLRIAYNLDDAQNRIPMMISYLRWPTFLSMGILPDDIKESFIAEIKKFIMPRVLKTSRFRSGRFYLEEIDQIERLCQFMIEPQEVLELTKNRKDFGLYIREYDVRRHTDFNKTFPTLSNFYADCLRIE